MQITFLGAAGTVTGSKYLVAVAGKKILLDCGLFQGYKELRLKNWQPLPVKASEIDAVILSHAHIDHSGYLPLLVKNGFKGKIYCSYATFELCQLLLPDSGHLQEEEAAFANRNQYSKHHPALPLYTEEDARISLSYFKPVELNQDFLPFKDMSVKLIPAGHILGAASVYLASEGQRLLLSGDLGRSHDAIMRAPQIPPAADVVLIESTYGDRLHPKSSAQDDLEKIINETANKGGTVLLPAFAVGRAQHVLYDLWQLKQHHRIPDLPIYVDSPMASDVTELFYRYHELHRLTKEEALAVCQSATYTRSVEESKALTAMHQPRIIISASGMATGGRVLHHLRQLLPDNRNAIVFCGFQAGGTRGDRLVRGEKQIKMFGAYVPVHASIFNLEQNSAHADADDLIDWLKQLPQPPKQVYVVHGEPKAANALKLRIEQELHLKTTIPNYMQKVDVASS